MGKVKIQVPATTANFGPGFDCVGIALELYNYLEAQWTDVVSYAGPVAELAALIQKDACLVVDGEGREELQAEGLTLFFRALAFLLYGYGVRPRDLRLHLKNEIPLARGLGSSAACIVAALCLGREVLRDAGGLVSDDQLASAAVELEGHPDNVLPALYGGACLNIVREEQPPLVIPFTIPEELDFIVVVPSLRISTEQARNILPSQVSLSEAVRNSALLGGLLLSLARKEFSHLGLLLEGRLHVPYRAELIPGFYRVREAALKAGALACTISGSGPTLLAVALQDSDKIGKAMCAAFASVGVQSTYLVSKVEKDGAVVHRAC